MSLSLCDDQSQTLSTATVAALARRAVEREPENANRHAALAKALFHLLDAEASEASWRRAIELAPDRLSWRFELARCLMRLGRYDEAIVLAEESMQGGEESAAAHALIANAFRRSKNSRSALQAAQRALLVDSRYTVALNYLVEILYDLQRFGEGERACQGAIEEGWASTKTLALYAQLHARLENQAACRALLDYDRLIYRTSLPRSGAELTTFNSELAEIIEQGRHLQFEPAGYPVHNGKQRILNNEINPSLTELSRFIQQSVEEFSSTLGSEPHPWLAMKPNTLKTTIWGVTLDRSGHQDRHIHVSGWMSGVYYVKTPDSGDAEVPGAGALVFGADEDGSVAGPECTINPYPGLLVMFPSYFYHGTTPTSSDAPRISIAFDVLRNE